MEATTTKQNSLEHLLAELRRINSLITLRVQQFRDNEQDEAQEEFRGLYVSEEEIAELLADPTLFLTNRYAAELETIAPIDTFVEIYPGQSRLSQLQLAFNLSAFEIDVLLLTLAPELDLRYERLFAFLQNDVTRRRPAVDLMLRMLCDGLAAQIAARHYFDSHSPLFKYGLLEFADDKATGLLARTLKLNEGVIAYLLGQNSLDLRIRDFARFISTNTDFGDLLAAPKTAQQYKRLLELAEQDPNFVCLLLGLDETLKLNLVTTVCQNLNKPIIKFDLSLLLNNPKASSVLPILSREVGLYQAALYCVSYDALLKEDAIVQEVKRQVDQFLSELNELCFISTPNGLVPLTAGRERHEFYLELELPGYSERQRLWESQLKQQLGIYSVAGLDLEVLASRFRLNSGQIMNAVATACNMARWRGDEVPTMADLEAACRQHSNQKLSSLARKITPKYKWDDIVLPADQFRMLREIYAQVSHRTLVYEKWGFDRKLSMGKGLNVIFAGPSGTGKTMSAEIVAHELGMDLYKIDLSNVVSKYIGETEKNLERIFNEARESNGILFFDEADSIFGKRSEVKDAHDRYANIETGYLLQKMEEYDGIVVLATNLRKNLDDAFVRRMHFVIEYPFPEEADRLEIWRKAFPHELPLGDSVDLPFMARQFKLAGGNIKNIALAAAFLAADDVNSGSEPKVEMEHIVRATRREYQKMGKLITEMDFGSYLQMLRS